MADLKNTYITLKLEGRIDEEIPEKMSYKKHAVVALDSVTENDEFYSAFFDRDGNGGQVSYLTFVKANELMWGSENNPYFDDFNLSIDSGNLTITYDGKAIIPAGWYSLIFSKYTTGVNYTNQTFPVYVGGSDTEQGVRLNVTTTTENEVLKAIARHNNDYFGGSDRVYVTSREGGSVSWFFPEDVKTFEIAFIDDGRGNYGHEINVEYAQTVHSDDLDGYVTSGDMQSAFTLISETQQVAAAGLNQLEGRIDELSGNTPDMSAYWTSAETQASFSAYTPTANFATINGSAITNGGDIVIQGGADMSAYYTSAQTEDAISAATAGKADAANVTARISAADESYLPAWNEQGVITGDSGQRIEAFQIGFNNFYIDGYRKFIGSGSMGMFYAPTTSGNPGEVLVADGTNTPKWSAVTFPDVSNYVTSAQVETQITSKGYATVSQIPTSNTAFTNDAGYITSAATANMVTSTSVSTIWKGTQAEYDAIVDKDPNTFYIIVNN